MSDDLDTSGAVADFLTGSLPDRARVSIGAAANTNADHEATTRRLSQMAGVPVSAARSNPEAVKRAATLQSNDFDALAKQFPSTMEFMAHGENARVAHDDISALGGIEAAIGGLTRYAVGASPGGGLPGDVAGGFRALASGVPTFNAGAWGAAAYPFEAVGADSVGQFLRGQQRKSNAMAKDWLGLPEDAGFARTAVMSGFQSAGQNLLTLPVGLANTAKVSGETAMLGLMGLNTFGQSYGKARDKGAPVNTSMLYGAEDAVAEVVTEKFLGAAGLLRHIKAGSSAGKMFGYEVLKEVPGEIAATVWQNFNEWGNLNPTKTVAEFVDEQPAAIAQTIIATLVGGASQIGAVKGFEKLAGIDAQRQAAAVQAEQNAALIEQANKLGAESKLAARDSDSFKALIAQVADERGEAPTEIFIDQAQLANSLNQSGMTMREFEALAPVAAQQLQTVPETGGLVRVPVSEFMAAGEKVTAPLVDHIRVGDPEALTRLEAREDLKAEADRNAAEFDAGVQTRDTQQAFDTSVADVRTGFEAQLNAAKRFTAPVNKAYSELLANFYGATAARLGITPAELMDRYKLRVQADVGQGARTLNQVATDTPEFANWFGDSKVVDYKNRPQPMYHGTNKSEQGDAFSTFDSYASNYGLMGQGSYFTADPAVASDYTKKGKGATPTVYQVFLSIKNPIDMEDRADAAKWRAAYPELDIDAYHEGGTTNESYYRAVEEAMRDEGVEKFEGSERIQDGLRAMGYDGITHVGGGRVKSDGKRHRVYIAFDPEQVKSATGNRGTFDPADPNILNQGDTPRAQIALATDITASPSVISLLAGADLSSFIHESGHFFLEVQADLATRIQQQINEGASVSDLELGIVDDMNRLLEWFGVNGNETHAPLEAWGLMTLDEKREAHEKFARGFERYTMEGTAPSIALQAVFQRFRSWLVQVYKTLRNLNVELTDDVRAVMGRMLATDTAIEEAEAQRSMGPLFRDEKTAGMTLDEFRAYQATAAGATAQAAEDLQVRGMKDMRWLGRARDKALKARQAEVEAQRREVRQEVRAEVYQEPVYRAWQFLTGKAGPAEQATDIYGNEGEGQFGKLRTEVLREMYGTDESAVWRELSARRMTSDATGMHPEIVAETFGFDSADALVQALARAMPPAEVVEARTDQRMLERFGDITSPEALARAADEAVHNEARARFIASELRALQAANDVKAKRTDGKKGSVNVIAAAAKDYAQQLIARLKIREIRPGQYAAAEARNAREAKKALESGKLEEAALYKRNQLINNRATRAAFDAQEEVAKAVKYLRSVANSKTLDPKYREQIEALLEKYDLSSTSGVQQQRTASLRTWVMSRLAEGQLPHISETLLSPNELAAFQAEAQSRDENGDLVYADDEEHLKLLADAIDRSAQRPYRDLTLDELRGLRDTVEQIEHLGRLKHKMLTAAGERAYEEVRDEMVAAITENAAQSGKNKREPNDWLGKKLAAVRQFGAAHIKVATWAQIMDGGAADGAVWRNLIMPANKAAALETTRRATATADLDAIFRPVLSKASLADKMLKGRDFPTLGTSLNWGERFRLAMNVGTESNLQRLLDGGIVNDKGERIQLTMERIMPVLRSLTAEEWRAVQAAWDFHEKMWPDIEAMEKRVSGVAPDKIPPRPITVVSSDGQTMELRGGYTPIVYDTRVNLQASQHEQAREGKDLMRAAYSAANVTKGFTKRRLDEVHERPLSLSMRGFYNGVNDAIHYLAWQEWIIDANKLLRSNSIDGAIREHYGPEVKREFEKWRDDIVAGTRRLDHAIEQAAGWARQSVSMSALTFNVMSAAMQPLGITQSMVRIGPGWVGKGVARYVAAPIEATREANVKSEWMRNRTRTRFRELNELRNQVQGQTAGRELMGRYGYWMMMRAQQLVDVPTWWGGYEKAIADGRDEDTAVALADQGVKDSQGGGEEVDQSGVERGGPLVKLFTAFYGFMGTALNTGYLSAKTETSKAKIAASMVLLYTIPAILGLMLKDALTPGDGDEDKNLLKKLAAEQITYLLGLIAFGREFSQAAKTLLGEDKGMSYSGPAGLRIIPDTGKLAQQVRQGELDDGFRKAFVSLLGDLAGLPSVQINRTITGVKALSEGKTENPAAVLFGYQEPH